VESIAEYWWRAKAVGEPVLLTAEEMKEALKRFETYASPSLSPSSLVM
jgi:hypothetical protein